MRRLVFPILLLPTLAFAAPDRAGLIQAWEAAMRRDGTLEAEDGGYRYRSESLGYDGSVRLLAAIVRAEGGHGADHVAARGTVDFDLPDLPVAQPATPLAPVGVASWKAERQNFVYTDDRQAWLSIAEWAAAYYRDDERASDGFWSRWSLVLGLLGVLLLAFALVFAVQRRAWRLLRESADVNRLGRENIARAAELRDAQFAATQESLELARRNAATLAAILEELRRRG
ncbi:hypothetical protein [Dokdonella sp.]|uniref:hypothetical protein n=1 Tax=Dokdonella sp. TaxID=2291710 RepID=UPI002F423357